MQKILFFFGACALFLFLWGGCSSCNAFKKVSKEVRITDSFRVKDSIRHKTVIHRKDSTVIKDTLIRVKYDRAEYSFPANSTKDTAIRSGRATLRKTVNNGVVTVQADCDSFDILVNDMRIIIHDKNIENETLSNQFSEYKKSHSETTVKVAQQGWFARAWLWVKNLCTLLVAIWLVLFILRRIFKF